MAKRHGLSAAMASGLLVVFFSGMSTPTSFVPPGQHRHSAQNLFRAGEGVTWAAPLAVLSMAGPADAADYSHGVSMPGGLSVFSMAFLCVLAYVWFLQPKPASAYYGGTRPGSRPAFEKIAIERRRDLIGAFVVMMAGDGLRWQGMPPWGWRIRGINSPPEAGRGYKTREADFQRERTAERWQAQEKEGREEFITRLKDAEARVVGGRLSSNDRLRIKTALTAPIGG